MLLRDQKVLLDADLAALYGVPTKRFNEQVKRNLERFPSDFMFQLTAEEFAALRSHFATSNDKPAGRWGWRYLPFVFTEHGAIMAAMVLNSARATEVSVYVVRAFVKLREVLASHHNLAQKLAELEQKTEALAMRHDAFAHNTHAQLRKVFGAIRELMEPPETTKKRPIGFVNMKRNQVRRWGEPAKP
jgi:hypothetical protein